MLVTLTRHTSKQSKKETKGVAMPNMGPKAKLVKCVSRTAWKTKPVTPVPSHPMQASTNEAKERPMTTNLGV